MYFVLNGKRSDENKIRSFVKKSLPILPVAKTYTMAALDNDNDYDFSNYNNDNRPHYDERVMELEIYINGSNYEDLQRNLQTVAKFLFDAVNGYVDLVFSNNPNIVWQVKLQNYSNATTLLYKIQRATLIFKCKAFPIGATETFTQTITASQPITINVKGDMPVRPIIKFEGTSDLLRIKKNDEYIEVSGIQNAMVIFNFENRTIIKRTTNEQNIVDEYITENWNGNFYELAAGDNIVDIETNGNGTLTIEYNPKYLF